jgi:putative peptidoglycan lipid II flippase
MKFETDETSRVNVKAGLVLRGMVGGFVSVGFFAFFTSVLTTVKELVVASRFGAGDDMDAYLIAFLLPSFVSVTVSGSFNPAFVPSYIKILQADGPEALRRFVRQILFLSTALLLLSAILLLAGGFFALPFLGASFSGQKLALTRTLFFVLAPTIVATGLLTVYTGILNACGSFALAASATLLSPLTVIAVLLLFSGSWGIYALAFGTLLSTVPELLILRAALVRRGFSLRSPRSSAPVAQIFPSEQYLPLVASALIMSATNIVDQAMAASLGSGAVSTLSYGKKLVSFIISVISLALSTAALPLFSRLVAQNDWKALRRVLRFTIAAVVALAVPGTLMLIYASQPLVRLLFQRGSFTAVDTLLVSKVQQFHLIHVPLYIVGILGVRLLSALSRNHLLILVSSVNLVVDFASNYILMRYFGVAGIALSSTMVYTVAVAIVFYFLLRIMKAEEDKVGQPTDTHG